MNGLWNLWDIKSPPICIVKTPLRFKEMTEMNEITFQALKTLRDLDYFHKEAAILSRYLYKFKRIFRHDKGMQNLEKINQCLKRYLKLDMVGVVHTFKQSLPPKFILGATHAYLPTQQMLKWVLLKFQAFSCIFVRLTNLTKEVGAYFLQKSWLGWALSFSLTIFSISARILSTSKYLVKKTIEWYNSLHKYLPFLQQTSDFLPNYNLPTNLSQWLGSIDLSPMKKKTCIDEVFKVIDLVNVDDEDEDNEIKIIHEKFIKSIFKIKEVDIDSDIVEVAVKKTQEKGIKQPTKLKISQNEDLGVPVNIKKRVQESRMNKNRNRQKKFKKVKKTLESSKKHGINKNFVGSF